MSMTYAIKHGQHHEYHSTGSLSCPIVREECWTEVFRDIDRCKDDSVCLLDRIDEHSVHIMFYKIVEVRA